MAEPEAFFDPEVEPDAVCGNCDYYSPTAKGRMCANTHSPKYTLLMFPDDACRRFFPDGKRWPEADHD